MLFHFLSGLPVLVGAAVFIACIVLVSLGGALLFHRYVPHAILAEHNEIAGFVFAVVGVVYAVLLAFIAIGVWGHFEVAEQDTYDEASHLTVVYRKADLFPHVHMLRAELRRYVTTVIDREWDLMYRGQSDERAHSFAEHMAYQVRHLPVKTLAQQNGQAAMLDAIDLALVDRDARTSLATIGISGFVWAILLVGAAVTIVFAYLFAYRNRWSLIIIVGMLAFMLGLVLYLIAAIDYPFRGQVHVGPEAFVNALETFHTIGR